MCVFYVRCRFTAITELNDCSRSHSHVNYVISINKVVKDSDLDHILY